MDNTENPLCWKTPNIDRYNRWKATKSSKHSTVNAVVIKADCQSVWQWLSSRAFILFTANSSSLERIRSFEISWNDREDVYFGSALRQNVTECLTRGSHCVQSGVLFSVCILYESDFCLWDAFNTKLSQLATPEWSCDSCHVFKDSPIIFEEGWNLGNH